MSASAEDVGAALEARIAVLEEALADMVNQFAYWHDGPRPGITTGGLSALEGAFDALGYSDPQPANHLRCDEPGCTKAISAGTPTLKGYRQTCHEHLPVGLTPAERAELREYQRTHPLAGTFQDWIASR